MTDREMAAGIGLGDHVVQEVIGKFWILQNSSPVDGSANLSQKNVSSHLLEQYALEGGDFLCSIMMGNEN
jgi:hypothetical protein